MALTKYVICKIYMFCKRLKIGYSKKATGFQFLIAVILLHSAALVMNEIRGTTQTQTHADINSGTQSNRNGMEILPSLLDPMVTQHPTHRLLLRLSL